MAEPLIVILGAAIVLGFLEGIITSLIEAFTPARGPLIAENARLHDDVVSLHADIVAVQKVADDYRARLHAAGREANPVLPAAGGAR